MSRRTTNRGMMNLMARLERLESLTGKNSCPWCRLAERRTWPDYSSSKTKSEDHLLSVYFLCDLCGQRLPLDVSDNPGDMVDMIRVFYGSTMEDQFTDPKAWAAKRWHFYQQAAKQLYLTASRPSVMRREFVEEGKLHAGQSSYQPLEDKRAGQAGPDFKLLSKLQSECRIAFKRKRERLIAKHGKNPFPDLDARIGAAKSDGFAHLYQSEPFADKRLFDEIRSIELAATVQLKCAEAEKIVLGQATATTSAALADCEALALKSIAAARHRHEAWEDERRRKAEETERRTRPSNDPNHAASAPAAANIPHPFWAEIQRQEQSPDTLASQQRRSPDTLAGGYDLVPPPKRDPVPSSKHDPVRRHQFPSPTKPPPGKEGTNTRGGLLNGRARVAAWHDRRTN